MNNDIKTLRDSLFAVLAGLKDGSIAVDKARAMNETAQTLINSAKVEVDFIKTTGSRAGTGFIDAPEPPQIGEKLATASGSKTVTRLPGGSITSHLMR